MSLPSPREGSSIGFKIYPSQEAVATLTDPETYLWSSIRHLSSREVAENIAESEHGVKNKQAIRAVGNNLKVYLQQAQEFYDVAKSAKPNTAPLIYYYSFLNLAKAICELRNPSFHKMHEYYRHGISWRPRPDRVVNLETASVTLITRGVWHVLWESLLRKSCPAQNPTQLKIKNLLRFCSEISVELFKTYNIACSMIEVKDPNIIKNDNTSEAWLRFSVDRSELKIERYHGTSLINDISSNRTTYQEVQSNSKNKRTFESLNTAKYKNDLDIGACLRDDLSSLNIFSNFDLSNQVIYQLGVQKRFPFPFPQIMVLYSMLFWLGSLTRYDPHSLNKLMDSYQWILIDAFMSESRVWLLQLFEWALYQSETHLMSVP